MFKCKYCGETFDLLQKMDQHQMVSMRCIQATRSIVGNDEAKMRLYHRDKMKELKSARAGGVV